MASIAFYSITIRWVMVINLGDICCRFLYCLKHFRVFSPHLNFVTSNFTFYNFPFAFSSGSRGLSLFVKLAAFGINFDR